MASQGEAPQGGSEGEGSGGPVTVSHLLGEMTWLLTQSPLHRAFSIGDIEWLVMPALILTAQAILAPRAAQPARGQTCRRVRASRSQCPTSAQAVPP